MPNGTHWTPVEDAAVLDTSRTPGDIARAINRTAGAVAQRRGTLLRRGFRSTNSSEPLTSPPRGTNQYTKPPELIVKPADDPSWTSEQDALVTSRGTPVAVAAKAIGCTPESLFDRYKFLNAHGNTAPPSNGDVPAPLPKPGVSTGRLSASERVAEITTRLDLLDQDVELNGHWPSRKVITARQHIKAGRFDAADKIMAELKAT